MPDFSIIDVPDDGRCVQWLERHFHPAGLACPRCGSTNRRKFRPQQQFPAYRCRACDGYYTALTGTIFEKTRQRPAVLVLLLRGIAKGESAAALARELGMSRQQVLALRQRIQTQQNDTTEADAGDQNVKTKTPYRNRADARRMALNRRYL
jgi:transposase-like protein